MKQEPKKTHIKKVKAVTATQTGSQIVTLPEGPGGGCRTLNVL